MSELLIITIEEYTEKDFYNIKQKCHSRAEFWNKLPEWCIDDNGKVQQSDYCFQFMGVIDSDNPKKYKLFSVDYVTNLLNEEINNIGFDYLINDNEIDLSKFIENGNINTLDSKYIPAQTYLEFYMKYNTMWSFESDDCDLEIDCIGILKFNQNKGD